MEKIYNIIQLVLKKTNSSYLHHKFLKITKNKIIILVNNKIVIKIDENNFNLICEYYYYSTSQYSPAVIMLDIKNAFLAYYYIEGKPVKHIKFQLFNDICSLNYNEPPFNQYGYLNSLCSSWQDFIINLFNNSVSIIPSNLISKQIIDKIIYIIKHYLNNYEFNPKLIHGDLGIYNLIIHNDKLVGIIDPYPIIGNPLYDLLFFFTSSKQLLLNNNLHDIFDLSQYSLQEILVLFLPILINRISREYKNNSSYYFYIKYLKKLFDLYDFDLLFP